VPVRSISLRAGVPRAVELGTTKWTVPPSAETWPWWPCIDTVLVTEWNASFASVLARVGTLKHLEHVPWHELDHLNLASLEVFNGGVDPPIGPTELVRRCPSLKQLSANLAPERLEALSALRHLQLLDLFAAPTDAIVLALSRLQINQRRIFHQGLAHQLRGSPNSLDITTSVYQPDFDPTALEAEDAAFASATTWALTDDTIDAFPALASWFMTHRRSGRRTA
jgi:hypothetical protein